MDRPIVHSNFARPLADRKSTMSASASASASASSTSAAGTTATTTAATKIAPTTTTSQTNHNSSLSSTSAIQYDHETYLELVAGRNSHVEKTASQLYKEERARILRLRAQDPAVLTGPVDWDGNGAFGVGG